MYSTYSQQFKKFHFLTICPTLKIIRAILTFNSNFVQDFVGHKKGFLKINKKHLG